MTNSSLSSMLAGAAGGPRCFRYRMLQNRVLQSSPEFRGWRSRDAQLGGRALLWIEAKSKDLEVPGKSTLKLPWKARHSGSSEAGAVMRNGTMT